MKPGMLAVCMLLVLLVSGASAQETMELYVQEGALAQGKARQVLALLSEEMPDAAWTLEEGGASLRERVMRGDAPDLAICAPKEARPWAKEGMLVPLQAVIGSQTRMQRQVLDLCVEDEALFMAPLIAYHRQMAVNRRRFEEHRLDYMLDARTYPVWYPTQFYQILEEFLLQDETAVDIWLATPQTSAALEALTQSVFGGMLLSEDGKTCEADSLDMRAGVRWLRDAVDDGLIGCCGTREDALERFVSGETAIFIDWVDGQTLPGDMADIMTVPYPSAVGLPVRSFVLTGVCAFAGGDARRDALAQKACVILHEQAQEILGARGIWQDGAIWPASLDRDDRTSTLRSLLCTALDDVMQGRETVEDALDRAAAAMRALR
ncbi:MAG: hypothetical protein IKJ11_03590 [Clostridia bacterium]|nr:hypothetical protein [Clostridia bacterium]